MKENVEKEELVKIICELASAVGYVKAHFDLQKQQIASVETKLQSVMDLVGIDLNDHIFKAESRPEESAGTDPQQPQAGSEASPKPCANCHWLDGDYGDNNVSPCETCHGSNFKKRTASAC